MRFADGIAPIVDAAVVDVVPLLAAVAVLTGVHGQAHSKELRVGIVQLVVFRMARPQKHTHTRTQDRS